MPVWLAAATQFVGLSSAQEIPLQPTRIVIECEDMQGVEQNRYGPGRGWQVGRWGHDLYHNMTFGGVWASRLRTAMTDAGDAPARAFKDIEVPVEGTYKIWVKYEAPPFFNYAFGLRIEPLNQSGQPQASVFDKVYGLLDAAKHFSSKQELTRGSLYWAWGLDHDAAEGYEAMLPRGRYRVTLYKTANAQPAGARSVDAILITSDLSPLSAPHYPQYPLLDELRRANHVYFRFRNLGTEPVRIAWNHWNHRYPDFLVPQYRELIQFFDDGGNRLDRKGNTSGDWPEPIAPGQSSVWYDLGPTMNTESTSPFIIKGLPLGARDVDVNGATPSLPVAVDIALEPRSKQIVKSFQLDAGETELTFLVQPDLHRAEGVQYTHKISDIYRDITRQLNNVPRPGPIPRRLKLYASTQGHRNIGRITGDFNIQQQFRHALGLNTVEGNYFNKEYLDAVAKWWQGRGPLIPRSLAYWHSQDAGAVAKFIKQAKIEEYFQFLSYGDETGLPDINVRDPEQIAAFHKFLEEQGQTPQSLGLQTWEQVRPLNTFSPEVAGQIGVLPGDLSTSDNLQRLKRLYWYSLRFRIRQGTALFAAKTRELKAALGEQAQTTVNLGGEHPFYWMPQASFIEPFKHQALSFGLTADYTYPQPEASRLVADFEAAYLRKGTSYHDQPMTFYCTLHYPGNNPRLLLQNVVLLWGQNVKDINFYDAGPDAFFSENYVAYRGGLPTWKTVRMLSGMAGQIEDDLLPARPVNTPVAMLLSESSDVWELEGKTQWDVAPGTVASNVSQEERKNLWYALRLAGYRVDFVTEDDLKDGQLKKYKVLYVCGQNLQREAAVALKQWVEAGGTVFATAGAARKDEFDEPLTLLDTVLGRGPQRAYKRYRGPLRARLELPFAKPLDRVQIGTAALDALCSKETFEPVVGARVLGHYGSDKTPAWVQQQTGKGTGYYVGTLPGQAFVKAALPVAPMGKGGPENSMAHFDPVRFDAVAREVILRPLRDSNIMPDVHVKHDNVVTNRLAGPASTVLPIVNLAEQQDGKLKNLEIVLNGIAKRPQRVRSCFFPKGIPFQWHGNQVTVTLPALQSADVIVVSN